MGEAAWALSALLTLGFLIAAIATGGAMAIGYFVLAVGMAAVTYVRFNARRTPRSPSDD
ncbi:hypothetical protein [Actinospongicola halichondriae]|uniref:hypothetical protein n=1 Tax=Actinospongicola halichondriae TaxID=3236844 RepID=UPI003D39AF7D